MIHLPFALSNQQIAKYDKFISLRKFSSINHAISSYLELFEKYCTDPSKIKSPKLAGKSAEQVLRSLSSSLNTDLLIIAYDNALRSGDASVALDGLYSYNILNWKAEEVRPRESGEYDHCLNFQKVLYCLAGNNHDIIQKYFPSTAPPSSRGEEFLVTGTNLFLAMNGQVDVGQSLRSATKFLKKKKLKWELNFIDTLVGVLQSEPAKISKGLAEVSMNTDGGWMGPPFMPFSAYAIYALSFRQLERDCFEKIEIPTTGFWWKNFSDANRESGFQPGKPLLHFPSPLDFMNEGL